MKVQSLSKTKRLREVPETFEALKNQIETIIKDERDPNTIVPSQRDYHIKYQDGDDEMINVSDDDDLQTAFDVA